MDQDHSYHAIGRLSFQKNEFRLMLQRSKESFGGISNMKDALLMLLPLDAPMWHSTFPPLSRGAKARPDIKIISFLTLLVVYKDSYYSAGFPGSICHVSSSSRKNILRSRDRFHWRDAVSDQSRCSFQITQPNSPLGRKAGGLESSWTRQP